MNMDYLENIYRRVERMVKPFVTIDGKRCFGGIGMFAAKRDCFIIVIWGSA